MPFALDGNPSPSEISDALNYLLSNFNVGNTVDPVTGQVVAPGGIVVGYIYQYLAVKYADDQFGTGFSSSPTGKNYYGLNNSNNSSESTNAADYIWYEATGGFGTTKFLWYISTGGRQIQFAVSTTAPDTAWLVDPGSSIDLDVVTSGNIPVIAETFTSYFTPSILFVPRTGNPLTPQFTGITPTLYATNGGVIIPYSGATTDSNVAFVNNSWRIGNSPTTGLGDISYTNITIGNPTDMGDYAEWPAPTAMTGTAYIDVPIRFKDSLGNVTQASVASIQLAFADPGVNGDNGPQIDFSGYTGFSVNNSNVYTPATATLSAIAVNVTSPTYSWVVTGGTPTTGSSSSIVVTPNSSTTAVVVSLTVNGTNLASPVTVTKSMPVTFDGVPGTAGANGLQSAFPSIYIWTGSSATPTRPSTTSTYTWSTGSYTAPSGWSTTAPSNTTAGNYLWQITVPLTVSATTTTSTLDWTNTSYPIRSIAYNGTNGLNASILTLSATSQTFTYNGSGAASPSSQTITFTAGLQNLTGTAAFSCTLYNSSGSSIGTVTLGGSGNNRTLTNSQFSGASYAVVQATLSGYSDLMTVVRLQDGATGATGAASVTGLLTNEAASVAATSSGTVPSFAGTGGNFLVYSGTTDVTSSSTFSVASSSGVTISITSGGVYTVTAMSANQGSATLRAVYGSVTIDKVYNISKAIAGIDGANASVLTLTSTGLSFTYDGSGNASPSSQTLSFTANLQNLTGTATFTCTLYNSAGSNIGTVTMGGSGNTRTLTDVQFSSAAYAVVIASLSGYSDTMTVVRLQNGANGTNGTNGTNGVSPIVGLLTNEAVTLQASSSGTVVSFTPGNGNFLVFQGTTDVSGSATYSVVSSSGITVSIAAGGAYTLSGMSANYGTATFRAVYGSVTIDKVYTVAKSIAGVDGLTASLLFLTSTSQSFTYDGTGAASPSSQTINFTANLQNLSGTASFNCDLYNSSGSNIGTVTLGGTGNTRSLTNAQFSTAAYAVINATLSGYSDTITVVKLQDGAQGSAGTASVTGLLTNESATVAANSSGTVPSFSGTGGNFIVYNGTTDVTSSSTFSVFSSSGVTISINSSGVYTVTAMSADQGSATLRAVYGSVTIDKVYNISKAIAGVDGANASVLTLTSTGLSFTYDGSGNASPSSQTLSFTANLQNLSGTATFSCTLYNSSGSSIGTVTMGGTGNTRTLTNVQFSSAAYAVVIASLTGYSDTMTVVRLQNGANGTNGTNGTNGVSPVVGLLTNEAVTLQASSSGTVVSFAPGNGNFLVYQGTTDVTSSSTFSVLSSSGITVSITSGGAYSISAMSANYGTATFRAVYGSTTIDKVYTVAKSIAGVDGLTASLLFLTSTAQTFTYDGTGSASPSSQTINFTANLQNLSGTASFTCDLYNSSGSNIGTVTLGGTGNTRSLTNAQFSTAAYAVINASLSGYSDTVTVVKVQGGANGATGAAGQNAVVGFLTNEAATVAADSSGNVTSFSGAGGTFEVFYGLTDVTSSSTFSVVSSTNVTISINSSGIYSISAMSANQGSATLQAIYSGTTIQKIYNISKSVAGASGTNGTRTAILDMYQWAASAPTSFPSGTSTYTWATGQFTAPATTNGWSLTPPTAVVNQTLWIARTIYADTGTSSTSSVTWTTTTATAISASGTNGANGTNGTNGTNGNNGYRTAFLELYQWNSSSPTAFPSGTSTYTWANGSFTAPATLNGWSLTPGASTPGYSLYACSVTYADTNTTSTSVVTWSTSISYVVGYSGVNGSTGATGATGSAGSATFLVTRTINDSSPPTNAEVIAVIGRNPVAGDIVTVSYNSANNAVVYRYTTSWVTQSTYLTGDLIVNGTITANKLSVTQLSAISANLGNITAGDLQIGSSPVLSGTSMTGTGAHIYSTGNFAFGNSTTNIVFDGSNVYMNGFVTATTAVNGGVYIDTLTTLMTFTVSKSNYIIVQLSGTARMYVAYPNITPEYVDNYIKFYIYDSSGTQLLMRQIGIQIKTYYINGTYAAYVPVSCSIAQNLSAGTYTLRAQSTLNFLNTSGSYVTSWYEIQNVLSYFSYAYESKI